MLNLLHKIEEFLASIRWKASFSISKYKDSKEENEKKYLCHG